MPSSALLHKTKLTVTISQDVAGEIDKIARKKKAPRSRVMEEMLRYGLMQSKKGAIEKEIAAYYLSLTEKEKKEDIEWTKIAAESLGRAGND